jgi:uncharacterized protein DUF6603
MSQQAGSLQILIRELGRVLVPLKDRLAPPNVIQLFSELGLHFPPELLNQVPFTTALTNSVSSATALPTLLTQLSTAIDSNNAGEIVLRAATLGTQIDHVFDAVDDMAAKLKRSAGALPGIPPAAVMDFADHLPTKLFDFLVVTYFETKWPATTTVLVLLGVIERVIDPGGDPEDETQPPFRVRRLQLGKLPDLLGSPLKHLQNTFGWGNPAFNGDPLFSKLRVFFEDMGMFARVQGGPPVLDSLLLKMVPNASSPPGIMLTLHIPVDGGFNLSTPIGAPGSGWSLQVTTSGQLAAGTVATAVPPASLSLKPPTGTLNVEFGAQVSASRPANPFVLVSMGGANRLEAVSIKAGLGFKAVWNSSSARAEAEFVVKAQVTGGKAVIDAASDGFLKKIFGGAHMEADFDMDLTWQPSTGISVGGSSAIDILLPIHGSIGPVEVNKLYLRSDLSGGRLPLEISAGVITQLGPLTAVVDRLGFVATLDFPASGGNLGPADLAFRLKPPEGVGLSLDAGGFKGGGFLMFDHEKGEYAGALELDFQGICSVKAIGIINTKMPDGAPGFSLLILISAEFTPIQLSFGFTLNGVGGIIGLNRTIVVAALVEGVRTNAIKSILFPENVVANISRIVSDIKQFFPPLDDHFVVGPMGKLGWGTPSLITLELGLLLDLPNPMFAIVGVLKAVLPTEDLAILRLQVNFIGILDFERGYVFFRADLYDSRLLVFSITGSLAFLVSWGEQQTFAVSVGGFHPDFRDFPSIPALPDGFRNMARIGISLLSDDNPRLKIESYFAVTSNSVQFGARVELYAEAAGFNVYGFLGYDVLFQFDPFRFIASLYGGIALRADTSVIAGISISAKLSGPTPWDAQGDASLTILFFEISVGFHVTWGDPPPAIQPETEDLLKLLLGDLADTRNWRAELPSNNHLHVSLRQIDPPAGEELLVIHPAGVLTFSQRSLPLEDYLIQKFGNKKPRNENKFKLTNANSNGTIIPADYQGVREQFAPGNFTELNDSDKLSRRSFERLPSGFKLTATSDLLTTKPVSRPVVYELSYLRRKESRLVFKGLVNLAVRAYDRLVKGSAVRQSVLSLQQNRISLNAPAQVVLRQESFAIANAADLKSHVQSVDGPVFFATQAEAYQRHQELINENPALAGQIQVVSHFELNQN